MVVEKACSIKENGRKSDAGIAGLTLDPPLSLPFPSLGAKIGAHISSSLGIAILFCNTILLNTILTYLVIY